MRPRHKLRRYQHRAVDFLLHHPRAMLQIDMSLGKTAICLTAIRDWLNMLMTFGVLVVAPRRVTETVWAQEARAWSHTAHLKVCVLRGRNKNLLARDLTRPFDVWVINYESLPWLVGILNKLFLGRGKILPFDTIVFDEVTRIKNPEGQRASLLFAEPEDGGRNLLSYFKRRVGLTGTPAPLGYWDLFGQFLAIDDGASLGRTRLAYQESYFSVDSWTGKRELTEAGKKRIEERIAPITISMRADDYLELPPYHENDIWVDLPDKVRKQYQDLEDSLFAEMDHGDVELFNAASLTAKCRQVANGIFIDAKSAQIHPIHDAKLEALDEIIEEAAGQPLLVSYIFRGDLERIQRRYAMRRPDLAIEYLGPGVSDSAGIDIINRWNAGKLHMLLSHHASAGHGLNLQHGGHQIVWFGLDWPLEGWLQLNARLRRPGQPSDRVIIHRILARETVDEAMMRRLSERSKEQDDLRAAMAALQEYRGLKLGLAA